MAQEKAVYMESVYKNALVRATCLMAMACGISRVELVDAIATAPVNPQFENVLDVMRDGEEDENFPPPMGEA